MNEHILSDIRLYCRALAVGTGIPPSQLVMTSIEPRDGTVRCPRCKTILKADWMSVNAHFIGKHFDAWWGAFFKMSGSDERPSRGEKE